MRTIVGDNTDGSEIVGDNTDNGSKHQQRLFPQGDQSYFQGGVGVEIMQITFIMANVIVSL